MPSEQQILKVIRALTPNSKKYLFDDAAIIACPRQVSAQADPSSGGRLRRKSDLIITTDTLVENTHFTLKTYTPREIGWKALAVNLSDIAAMGGEPLYALVSITLPKNIKLSWIKNLYKGINVCAKKYKTQIIGGNLARAKEINITITVIGKVVRGGFKPAPTIGKRSNARPGDLVFTTGTFGNAAAKNYKAKVFPQINLGQKIVRLSKRVALMDASDGLADCLIQIAEQSKVKIIIEEDKIPISQGAKKASKILNKDSLNLALYGGEDYQLVGTASEIDCKKLRKLKGIKIIGKVVKGNGAFLKQNNNKLVKLDMTKLYKHF